MLDHGDDAIVFVTVECQQLPIEHAVVSMGNRRDFEVWDADNHMYEAVDSYTRSPARSSTRTQSAWSTSTAATSSRSSARSRETIPNPTYVVVPTPGAGTEYYRGNNPEGKSLRELGEPDPLPRGVPAARPAAAAHGRAGHPRLRDVPDHRRPDRGAHEGRHRRHPRGLPRLQPVAARRLDVRLRGPHHPDARDHAARHQPRARRARLVPRTRRAHGDHPPCSRSATRRFVDLDGCSRSSTRSGGAARKRASR